MNLLFDSFGRAAAYCLHLRVIALSLLPLALMVALTFGAAYFFWESAITSVRLVIDEWSLIETIDKWLVAVGFTSFKSMLGPLVVVFLATPILVVMSLLVVAFMMAPAIVKLVAERRFPNLERRHGGSFMGSLLNGLGVAALALVILTASIPLWFIPPLATVVPPLIWGWLTYRVMSYDILAEHASSTERVALLARYRSSLLAIGVITAYLGAAPSMIWASGALFLPLAPILVPLAIWIYALVFAFSSLWFAHFSLAALSTLRAEKDSANSSLAMSASKSAPKLSST